MSLVAKYDVTTPYAKWAELRNLLMDIVTSIRQSDAQSDSLVGCIVVIFDIVCIT